MRFRERVAVVTGAAQGIGQAYAEAFAREGAAVVIADIDGARAEDTAKALAATGAAALALEVDVADEAQTTAMAQRAETHFGGIDVLVNNAGLHLGELNGTTELPIAKWRRLLDVNLLGALLCTKACRPALQRRGGGAVVNQSSMSSCMGVGAYSISKLALDGLTVSLARELAPDGIRVNGIAPGYVASEAAHAGLEDAVKQSVLAGQLIPRVGQPGDLVGTVLFLCSEAAGFVTGQTWRVDGGSTFRL